MITAEQRELRKAYAGSSDAAAICGADEYRSAADVWLEKTGQVDGFSGNDATDAGNRFEPVILDWAEQQLSAAILRDQMRVADCGILAANFDGIQPQVHVGPLPPPFTEPFVVEAKTTGIIGPPDPAYGEQAEPTEAEPLPELPTRVLVQVHHQMYVAGPAFRIAWVPVLIGGHGFRMYRVDRVDELADSVAERCRHFMAHHVRLGIRPDDYRPSLDVLKRVRREPNKVVEIAGELADRLIVARASRAQAERDEEAAQAAVLAEMGDAEAAEYANGRITYMLTTRKAYSVPASSYRTLRINKRKQAA